MANKDGPCTVRPIQFFNFLEKSNQQILLNYTVCVHFQLTRKMLNYKWVNENASFFHFSNFKINLKIRKILFMAKKDILSIFHFSVFLSNRKNAKMELSCGHFLFFDFSVCNRKRKNRWWDLRWRGLP